jgi:hypothetical protein
VHAQEVGGQGHEKSDGLQAYISSFNDVVDDCIVFFKSVRGLILSPLSFCTNFSFLLGDCTLSRERDVCVKGTMRWQTCLFFTRCFMNCFNYIHSLTCM